MHPRISIRGSVCPSVRPSGTRLFRIRENAYFLSTSIGKGKVRAMDRGWCGAWRGAEGAGEGDEGGGMHLTFGVTKLVTDSPCRVPRLCTMRRRRQND